MWQIEPQPEFILAAFPSFPLSPHLFLHVLEKTPPIFFIPLSFVHVSLWFIYNVLKKKKKKKKKKRLAHLAS